ncbi:MAG: hypothetical protein ACLSE4_09665 [Clostridium sp.]
MKKKVVSVALAAAMTAGVLAGCGGGSSKETTKAPEADKTRSQSRG